MTYLPYPPDNISTSEQSTEWQVEGKLIYRKLVKQSGNLSTGTNTVAHGITGMTKLLRIDGTITRSDGSTIPAMFHDRTTGSNFHVRCFADGTNITIELGTAWTGTDNGLSNAWLILEYLK